MALTRWCLPGLCAALFFGCPDDSSDSAVAGADAVTPLEPPGDVASGADAVLVVPDAGGALTGKTAEIGPGGGTLSHQSGGQLVVPGGAVQTTTRFEMTVLGPLGGLPGSPVGPGWALGPAGAVFARPLTLRLPLTQAAEEVAVAAAPGIGGPWALLPATAESGVAVTHTGHFSVFIPVVPSGAPPFVSAPDLLPDATVGTPWAVHLVPPGVAPHTWALGPAATPPGLTLSGDGVLSGTFSSAGLFTVTVRVTDAGGLTTERVWPLTVSEAAAPGPTLTSVIPASVIAGSPDTTVTLAGGGFVPGTLALVGDQGLSTTFVSASQVQAIVPAALLASEGAVPLKVRNPLPGGGTSSVVGLTVAPSLSVSAVSPDVLIDGTHGVEVVFSGQGLTDAGLTVSVDGASVSSFHHPVFQTLAATLPPALLTPAGTRQVRVHRADGKQSAPYPVTIEDNPGGPATAPVTLLSGLHKPFSITTYEGWVYVGEWNPGRIVRAKLNGVMAPSPPVAILGGLAEVSDIVVDASGVYATSCTGWNGECAVVRADHGGGGEATLATGQFLGRVIAVSDSHLFWFASGEIRRVPKAGGAVQAMASGFDDVRDLICHGDFVYWAGVGPQGDAIYRMLTAGGTPQLFAAAPVTFALASDDLYVYWIEATPSPPLRRRSVAGGAVETVVEGAFRFMSLQNLAQESGVLASAGAFGGSVATAWADGSYRFQVAAPLSEESRQVALSEGLLLWTNPTSGTIGGALVTPP